MVRILCKMTLRLMICVNCFNVTELVSEVTMRLSTITREITQEKVNQMWNIHLILMREAINGKRLFSRALLTFSIVPLSLEKNPKELGSGSSHVDVIPATLLSGPTNSM